MCYVFVNCLVKQFAICFDMVVILLLNVMEVEVLYWIYRVWHFNECVCCAYDSSVRLDVPSIGFVYVCICRK